MKNIINILVVLVACLSIASTVDAATKKKSKKKAKAAPTVVAEKPKPVVFPERAKVHLPILVETLHEYFPRTKGYEAYFAAQIEQETCISLKSKGCWNEKTELKTSREYGFGLGQITIAYNKDGSERFNNFVAARKLHKDLAGWPWEDRWNPKKGMLVVVLMMKAEHRALGGGAATFMDGLKFSWSAYNGGRSHVMKAKAICATHSKCDPYKWDGNVEIYLPKSKKPFHGYKVSPYEINTGYVKNITTLRYKKYEKWIKENLNLG